MGARTVAPTGAPRAEATGIVAPTILGPPSVDAAPRVPSLLERMLIVQASKPAASNLNTDASCSIANAKAIASGGARVVREGDGGADTTDATMRASATSRRSAGAEQPHRRRGVATRAGGLDGFVVRITSEEAAVAAEAQLAEVGEAIRAYGARDGVRRKGINNELLSDLVDSPDAHDANDLDEEIEGNLAAIRARAMAGEHRGATVSLRRRRRSVSTAGRRVEHVVKRRSRAASSDAVSEAGSCGDDGAAVVPCDRNDVEG